MIQNDTESDEPATVIVVDDSIVSLRLLESVLRKMSGIRVRAFDNPREALAAFRQERSDLVITDIDMPEMNGLQFIVACHATPKDSLVPIMVVTASTERDVRQQALKLGALDFLNKPLDADEVRARTRNLVALGRAQRQLADRSTQLAGEVRRAVVTIEKREKETILRLARAAEYRDWETGGHILRIAEYARIVALALDTGHEFSEDIALAAPLHDIGKIGIPDYVLCKPDRLDPEEFALMQTHTIIGHEILKGSHSRLLQLGGEIALTHHERFDGTGYPNGLAGDGIPLAGRIVAVADVFDAVTSRRPYKAAFPASEARAILQRGSGTQFDPTCVAAFLDSWDAVLETYERFADDSPHTDERLADPQLV